MSKTRDTKGILLRPCTLSDIGQVRVIERESFPEDPYSAVVFISFLMSDKEGFIVASSGGSVVGYVIGTGNGEEGMIQSMAVALGFRRRGVGAMLMESIIEHLTTKCRRVSLLVDVSNEAAIRTYRKFSFSETGRVIEGYYPNGNDAMEMARVLGN